jgi:hypothetical protein
MKMPFIIDKKVTLGELITILSIVFSSVSVLITWRNEQKIQMLENATRTRVELAKTMNTINKVIQIHLSFYDLIEEDIVEASHISVTNHDAINARDYMWEKFHKHRAELMNTISQSDWEVAYTNLMTYGIPADSIYIKSIRRLKGLQENQFKLLLIDFQNEILEFRTSTAYKLTDRLREIKNEYRKKHQEYAQLATADLNAFCLDLMVASDKHLLFSNDSLDLRK